MSYLKVGNIQSTAGTTKITTSMMPANGYVVRQILTQVDTVGRSMTGWALGPTFPTISMLANSLIKMDYYIPARNDASGWGGIYIEPQVQFNGGTWQSLGNTGYELMIANGAEILSYKNSIFINPGISTDFTVAFRFYFRPYDGTVHINNSNRDINLTTSGTAAIMSGDNGNQHFTHIIVQEYSRYS